MLNATLVLDEGFGVGHSRRTETKGIWMWSEPETMERDDGGAPPLQLLFFDTEGFESTGRADVYDDRIFALSSVLSAVLVYNLPETIRESDLERLSFAVELARAFYGDEDEKGHGATDGRRDQGVLEPGSMLWVIQRDFLQGATLQATLDEALTQVANPHNEPGLAQLNRIRRSLARLAVNSTALGLPQPHLNRTALCTLTDSQLTPAYVTARDALRARVRSVVSPKVYRGKTLTGNELARLVTDVVAALNAREIPTAGSLIDYFNSELALACREEFGRALDELTLPVEPSELESAVQSARRAALEKYRRGRFGGDSGTLLDKLLNELQREIAARQAANDASSAAACDAAEEACEQVLEQEARQRLPAANRFRRRYRECKGTFVRRCVGPARVAHAGL